MRAALVAVAADLPAMRKISQFLGHKADLGCTRCKFMAQREPHTTGASGKMCYFPSASEKRNHMEVKAQAEEFKRATSQANARRIAQQDIPNLSVRMPYFDIVSCQED